MREVHVTLPCGSNLVFPHSLAALGVFQEGMAKNVVDNKPVVAHLYEYTTQLSLDPTLKFKGLEGGINPCQILFCLKEDNVRRSQV